jgi:hypothetical protein
MGKVEKGERKRKGGEIEANYFKTTCRALGLPPPKIHHILHQDGQIGMGIWKTGG